MKFVNFICYYSFILHVELLHWYFKGRLEELNTIAAGGCEDENELGSDVEMDPDEKCILPNRSSMDIDMNHQQTRFSGNNKLVKIIGMVVRDLRSLGFTSMAEDAYASAIFLLLQVCVLDNCLCVIFLKPADQSYSQKLTGIL